MKKVKERLAFFSILSLRQVYKSATIANGSTIHPYVAVFDLAEVFDR